MIFDLRKALLFCCKLFVAILIIAPLSYAETKTSASHGPITGTLFLHGGGKLVYQDFIDLIQDTNDDGVIRVLVISTALGPRRRSDRKFKNGLPVFNLLSLSGNGVIPSEMYLTKKKEAKSPRSVSLINNADAIWITGGNQSYLTEVFNNTPSLTAMNDLLDRGGVIGGSSAGAQVQSSFMTRGDFGKRSLMGDRKHQNGFGFLKNVALDVHVAQRNRVMDLAKLYSYPRKAFQDQTVNPMDILGIGIDEGTSLVFNNGKFEVLGDGNVHVFDANKWHNVTGPSYQKLTRGDVYCLNVRIMCIDNVEAP